MSLTTLLIIVLLIVLLGGGGYYGRGRWYWDPHSIDRRRDRISPIVTQIPAIAVANHSQ